MLAYETLHGEVVEVGDTDVVVRFDTGDDIIEQTYSAAQFLRGKAPAVGGLASSV